MRLTTLMTSETTVENVVDRLYPNLSGLERQQVTTDLIKANPQLSADRRLRQGLVIQVPTILDRKTNAAGVTDDPVDDLRTIVKEAVSGYKDLLTERAEKATDDIARQEELLAQDDIPTAIKSSKEASKLAKELANALKTSKKALEDNKKVRADLFARIDKDLDSLFG